MIINRIVKFPVIQLFFWGISSWILIHLFALIGFFLAFAYPLWRILAPNNVFCLICHSKQEGTYCPFCQRSITKSVSLAPSGLRSVLLNSVLIVLFSLFAISVILIESKVLLILGFPPTPRTVSFVIPSKGQYRLDEIFPMKIELIDIESPINAIQADLGFDPSKLEVVDVSTAESFANIFIQKEIDNETGYVRLTGGLPNPGFTSNHGIFGTILFKAKSPGVVNITFLPTSLVLANDGKGTNVLKDFASVNYLILAEKISQEEAQLQQRIVTNTVVLGENTEDPQMIFYDEPSVLGKSTDQNNQDNVTNQEQDTITESDNQNIFERIFTILGKIDSFILDLWKAVFNLVLQKN